MAQPAYLSPRPSPHPLQNRRNASARRSGHFRPPQSPATPAHRAPERRVSSRTPNYASATATSTSRKRARPAQSATTDSRTCAATPQSDLGSTWAIPSLDSSAVLSDFASPEPFVITKYNLAGGLDTPGLAHETYFERQSQEDYGRRRRWTYSDLSPEETIRNHPKQRLSSKNGSPEQQQSWAQFMFSVAGKAWSFGSSAFKGFYAGGGRGYGMDTHASEVQLSSEGSMWESMRTSSHSRFGRDSTPVPGSYPAEEDDEAEYEQRPAKKVHLESGESPWVMVQNPMDEEPQRKKTLHQPPPPSRSSVSNRRSLIPISRRTSGYPNSAGSPAVQQPHHSASYAQQRSSSDITPIAKPSPLSPEAHKYLVDRKREERQQDASIKRMNDQLKALLKEGRQALGTKVEVIMDDDSMDVEDEGYFEDSR